VSPAYATWIAEYVQRREGLIRGLCQSAVHEMRAAFPELVPVRGHARFPSGGRVEHWWLVTPDGAVVDPTALQFQASAEMTYEPWTPGTLVKVGRCLECGDDIFKRPQALDGLRESFCGDTCRVAFDQQWEAEVAR
jgi:hypothetical protein